MGSCPSLRGAGWGACRKFADRVMPGGRIRAGIGFGLCPGVLDGLIGVEAAGGEAGERVAGVRRVVERPAGRVRGIVVVRVVPVLRRWGGTRFTRLRLITRPSMSRSGAPAWLAG